MNRGEVWMVNLNPTQGSEIRKTRPCLIVSPDDLNAHLSTVTVVPLTSKSRPAPFRVETTFGGQDGRFLCEQIRAVDKSRLTGLQGQAPWSETNQVLEILRDMFS